MDDIELYAVGRMSSSSAAMFARRRRILAEARRLIARGDPNGFSVRELCEKAEVAPNTLYNAFGNKENVAALAVHEYFEKFHANMDFNSPLGTFEGAMEREMALTLRNLAIPHYVRAVAGLYFSNSVNLPLRKVLIDIASYPYFPWLQRVQIQRGLERGVQIDRVLVGLSAIAWSQVHEWRLGELTDETFLTARFDGTLCYLAGVTRGEARKQVRAMFADLHGPRRLLTELRQDTQARIESQSRRPAVKK